MRIPDEILKSTTFIGCRSDPSTPYEYVATGFFVNFPSPSEPDIGYGALVTAKHVVDGLHGLFCCFVVNTKTGKTLEIEIPADQKWFTHPTDNDVDIAVLPLSHFGNEIDYKSIPRSMFADAMNEQQLTFGLGDLVFFSGLFANIGSKNTAVVRNGNIAIMPNGKTIPIKVNGRSMKMEAYVVEARSYGGMSGSPVFVRESTYLAAPNSKDSFTQRPFYGYGSFFLLGVGVGHWTIDKDAINDSVSQEERERLHRGLSVVAPSYKLTEVLMHPELEAMRKKANDDSKKNAR